MNEGNLMSNEIQKWSDEFMFRAEPSLASEGPKAFLLGGPEDPLGQIAACAKMYKGEVVRSLEDVTNEERVEYLREIQKTVLKMPLEAVSLHFMVEGVTRGFTHQMVRQRTAAFAQESTRFAVKEDMKEATALPPSLEGTFSLQELVDQDHARRAELGLYEIGTISATQESQEQERDVHREEIRNRTMRAGGPQADRLRWDEAVDGLSHAYLSMVNNGMPAEDARGLLPTNITTRLNYITNLRSFYDTMAVRVSDQAQFEWRAAAMAIAVAMQNYGKTKKYWTTITTKEYLQWDEHGQFGPILSRKPLPSGWNNDKSTPIQIQLSSEWQYVALTHEIKPVEFKMGKRAFGASFDRASRIGERVDAFAHCGVPSERWTQGAPEHNIPAIHPSEWLLDPSSARLRSDEEFDIFGNRVPKGSGWHWDSEHRVLINKASDVVQYADLHGGPRETPKEIS